MRYAKITLASCALLTASMLLNGCSIRDETSEEIMVEEQGEEIVLKKPRTKTEFFIQKCIECASGDLTYLDEIVETYNSTFTNTTDYPHGAFLYQRMKPTQAFESCALKALIEGNRMPYDNIIVRPNKIARVARYFYAYNQPTQGAYWLQRIVNIRGEVNGLEVAGRVFIQDPRTIGIGVQLLEQSARLGNRAAGQMLTGLMTPGSPYYQQLTTNTTKDTNKSASAPNAEKEQKADDISDIKNNLEALINERKKQRAANAKEASNLILSNPQTRSVNQDQNAQPQSSSVINIFDTDKSPAKKAKDNTATKSEDFSGATITNESQDVTNASKETSLQTKNEAAISNSARQDLNAPSSVSVSTENTAPTDASEAQDKNMPDATGKNMSDATGKNMLKATGKNMPEANASQVYAMPNVPSETVTEDILKSNEAELNIPLEFYEKAPKNNSSEDSKGSQAITPKADKDIKEAHQRLIERHEERLKQAKEKAEATAAAISNQQDSN